MLAAAGGGTLFLDEIAEMPATLQTRFLRVLQEREFRPLGSTKTLKADFRLVAATNQQIDPRPARRRPAARPLLPHQHLPDRNSSPARPPGRHRPAGRRSSSNATPSRWAGPSRRSPARRSAAAARFSLARQRAAVAKRHRIRRRLGEGKPHHRGEPAVRAAAAPDAARPDHGVLFRQRRPEGQRRRSARPVRPPTSTAA